MQDDTYEGAKFQGEILSRFRVDRELHTDRTPWLGINIRDESRYQEDNRYKITGYYKVQ